MVNMRKMVITSIVCSIIFLLYGCRLNKDFDVYNDMNVIVKIDEINLYPSEHITIAGGTYDFVFYGNDIVSTTYFIGDNINLSEVYDHAIRKEREYSSPSKTLSRRTIIY